ncbi:MAG: hypothetical protein IJ390_12735 [Lachnospiraceae bacterium]|nr:hypothetical protein [Lachnospiraceae bacterium]
MFRERAQREEKVQIQGAVASFDFGSKTAQISYCLPGAEKPETVSQVTGQEQYLVPALLARRTDKDLWLYGKEAAAAVEEGQAWPVSDLLIKAAAAQPVQVGEEAYDPVALLSLFIKKCLTLLTPVIHPDRLEAFVFTVEEVTKPIMDALFTAVTLLDLKAGKVSVIGRAESFFYYNISQPAELWSRDVMVCDFGGNYLKTYLFHANRRTTPIASFVEEAEWTDVEPIVWTEDEIEDNRSKMKLDVRFSSVIEGLLKDREVCTIYLLGEGFAGEWYEKSLQILCKNRRVFLGNNLYSKGACYVAKERLAPGSISKGYAFLGKDMLKANVGMHVSRRGRDAYLALLDAGINWYEAQKECAFLLEEENTFSLRITPLNGKEIREVVVTLTGLPKRPAKTSRIQMKVDMTDVRTVRICMEDMGFGEFFPATHKYWEESFQI